MQVTEDTKFLATEIQDYLTRYPDRHDQNSWVSVPYSDDTENVANEIKALASSKPLCNSTMCVAGTAVFLTTPAKEFKKLVLNDEEDFYETRGAELLGLDDNEAANIFFSGNGKALALLDCIAKGDEVRFARLADIDNVFYREDGTLKDLTKDPYGD